VLLRAVDRRFGAAAGVLYVGVLRQVRRYLTDPHLKATVDARVEAAVGERCRVLIGHSLGSLIAYEYLRQHPGHGVQLLLTLGSPQRCADRSTPTSPAGTSIACSHGHGSTRT
jgi:pimeloyl-ACP methyl ester carboxylesterase